MILEEFCRYLNGVRGNGPNLAALCPAHRDTTPSLSVCEKDGRILINCFAGCSNETILEALGLKFSDLFLTGSIRSTNGGNRLSGTLPAEGDRTVSRKNFGPDVPGFRATNYYDYCEPDGRMRFQIVRSERIAKNGLIEKKFRARRRPEPQETPVSDGWISSIKGIELIPYNLPGIAGAPLVYVVEGEKDVETLRSLELAATCNPFGAGKWRDEFSQWLSGKTVVILPDNDEPGRTHGEAVADSVYQLAKEVLIVELPGLPRKGDVTDFVTNGGTADDLMNFVQRAPSWQPAGDKQVDCRRTAGFAFTTLKKLIAEPPEEVSFVWSDTLPAGGLSICSAKPKVGKSTLARNLAVAVANGAIFLDRSTTKGRVLYLCLEEKRSEVRKHFERMGAREEDILVYTGATPKNAIDEIAAAVLEFNSILVIIDPLSRVLRVADFNEYGGMTRGLEPLIDLARRTGCCVLALHHDSKGDRNGGDALLGSTALFGAVDCHIQMKKRDSGRTIQTTQRYGKDMPETVIELDASTGIVGSKGSVEELTRLRVWEAILEATEIGESVQEATIKERVKGYPAGLISRALRELVEQGGLNKTGEGIRGNAFLYSKPER